MPDLSRYAPDPALRRRIRRFSFTGLLVAVLLAAWGIHTRVAAHAALARRAATANVIDVTVVRPVHGHTGEDIVLPGTVAAYAQAAVFARTSGYLKSWTADIGTRVRRGQRLATIAAPEVDQELSQAVADLANARANERIANVTNRRWQKLLAANSVSQQDADTKAATAAQAKAAVDSAAANVARLRELVSYEQVLAPFDGIVTARNTDVGALINAGQAPGSELFDVADTHALRIYVDVPEAYAGDARVGTRARLAFAEFPGRTLAARVERTAGALDPITRTLRVELRLANPQGLILPGSYVEAHFELSADRRALELPSNTVLFRSAGPQVATVGRDGRIALRRIVEGRDFGTRIEVLSGLEPDARVIVNPPDSSYDGEPVRVVPDHPIVPTAR
jgi:RND family efflux transporter MFP subunit